MGEPARVEWFESDDSPMPDEPEDPNPRAATAPEPAADASKSHAFVLVPKHARCCICAARGFDRPVVVTKLGTPTGLCQHHTEYEREYRAELVFRAQGRALTKEDKQQAARSVAQRMAAP